MLGIKSLHGPTVRHVLRVHALAGIDRLSTELRDKAPKSRNG
jgi:hypothetical protein